MWSTPYSGTTLHRTSLDLFALNERVHSGPVSGLAAITPSHFGHWSPSIFLDGQDDLGNNRSCGLRRRSDSGGISGYSGRTGPCWPVHQRLGGQCARWCHWYNGWYWCCYDWHDGGGRRHSLAHFFHNWGIRQCAGCVQEAVSDVHILGGDRPTSLFEKVAHGLDILRTGMERGVVLYPLSRNHARAILFGLKARPG